MRAKPVILPPVRPNAGVRAAYQRQIDDLLKELNVAILAWAQTAWRDPDPIMASDRTLAEELERALRNLGRHWLRRFEDLAPRLARYFATAAHRRSDTAMAAMLRKAGFTVQFHMTPRVAEVVEASVAENVTLIKSIASQHLTQVEALVMRSVQMGRGLADVTQDLQARYGVSRRRAAFIARTQNNKATAAFVRARQDELGIAEAQWLHSTAGKHPRPTHLKAGRDRVRYNVREGWLDPALNRRIWPGTEINCRCVSRSIIPGLARSA